jgi:transposase
METNLIFVGIDIDKATLDVDSYPAGEPRRFLNDDASCEELCEWLKTRAPTLIVMEPSGGLEAPIAGLLAAAGLPVAVISSLAASKYGVRIGFTKRAYCLSCHEVLRCGARGVTNPISFLWPLTTRKASIKPLSLNR